MKVIATEIPGVLLLEPKVFCDDRGFFLETYNKSVLQKAIGISWEFVQDNESRSKRGVLRGLHYQIERPQGKLVRVTFGEVFDVAVDLRRSSPTFGRWMGVKLDGQSRRMLWIPPGFAHGFLALSEWADVLYKTTDFYAPEHERVLLWNDVEVGVSWPLAQDPVISERDRAGRPLIAAEVYP